MFESMKPNEDHKLWHVEFEKITHLKLESMPTINEFFASTNKCSIYCKSGFRIYYAAAKL